MTGSMDFEKVLELVNYDSPTSRVAELAALFVERSLYCGTVDDADGIGPSATRKAVEIELSPGPAARAAVKLVGIGESLHKWAEHDCNEGLTPTQERRVEKLKAQAVELGEALGFRVETGGDPRGCVLKLYDPTDERAGDGFGGGWGVYA